MSFSMHDIEFRGADPGDSGIIFAEYRDNEKLGSVRIYEGLWPGRGGPLFEAVAERLNRREQKLGRATLDAAFKTCWTGRSSMSWPVPEDSRCS